jgi:hypothetical protein
MNQKLTEEIAYHVLSNLGVLPSDFVNFDKTKSVMDKQFLLPEKITFQTAEGNIIHNNVYGCQITITPAKDFKLLLADLTQEKNVPEYCLFIQLKDSPAFAVYLIFNRLVEDPPDSEALIGVSADKKFWMPCTVYLQATFLAGIEQLRDLGYGWSKCDSYKIQYEQMLSFIKFHDSYFGGNDEGEEV